MRGVTHAICSLTAGALLGLAPAGSRAQPSWFSFENLADSGGMVLEDFQDAKLNDHREVVFFAREVSSTNAGLFSGPDPATDTIADTDGPYVDFFDYALGNDGTVVFLADAGVQGFGFYTGPYPATDTFVDSSGAYWGFGSLPAINSGGTIAFWGSTGATESGLFAGPDPAVDTLVDNSGPFRAFLSHPALNDADTPAFVALLDDEPDDEGGVTPGATGVFTGPDPDADRVADSNGEYSTFTNYSPSINGFGEVVFRATLDDGREGIFAGPDPAVGRIADSDGAFATFGDAAINDGGTVVFRAVLDTGAGDVGIFTGPDAVADRVIGSGDSLFGGTVVDVSFAGHGALNNRDEIAFVYQLDSGVTGVALAPEPGSAGLIVALAAGLWVLRQARSSLRR